MSWNTLGLLINLAVVTTPVVIVGSILSWSFPDVDFWPILTVSAMIVVVPIAVLCAAFAVLNGFGFRPIKCPLCGKHAKAIGRESYTFLHCSDCGQVHSRGFFRREYFVDDDDVKH